MIFIDTISRFMPLTSTMAVPPGGFYYISPPRIDGGTFDQLVENVIEYRQANGVPIGNVLAEINDQICARWPQGCGAGAAMSQENPNIFEAITRFATAAKNFVTSGFQLVSQEEADRRSAICRQCHNNVQTASSHTGCKACGKAKSFIHEATWGVAEQGIEQLRPSVLQNRHTSNDTYIGKCGLCGCDLKLLAWLPLETLGYEDWEKNTWPSFCFRRGV